MGNWIQVHELNWIQFTKYESRWIEPNLLAVNLTWVVSTGSAGRVEFELSWALWKAVMMNLSWVLTQSTWIPSESESIIYQKESKNLLTFHHYNPSFFQLRRSTRKFPTTHNERSCRRLFLYFYVYCTCITLTSPTRCILKSVFQYYHVSEMFGISAVSPPKLHKFLPIKLN